MHCNLCLFSVGWSVMAMTFERLVVVYKPLHAKTICTKRNEYIIITVICLLGSAIYLHYFWTYGELIEIQESGEITIKHCTILAENKYLKYYIENIRPTQDLVARSALPFIFLLTCNILIIFKISKQYRRRGEITGTGVEIERKQNRMTFMLLSISFMHLICITPLQVLYFIDKSDPFGRGVTSRSDARMALRWAFAIDIYYFNSCINYLLYCLQGEEYRRVLKMTFWSLYLRIICSKRKENCDDHHQHSSSTRASIQTIT